MARDLKYRTHDADFGALARELHGDSENDSDTGSDDSADDHDEWSGHAEPSRD